MAFVDTSEPIRVFDQWYTAARECRDIADASATSLATADKSARPSVRMVLLKKADEQGFVFYTNLESPKARDLCENPRAALCFHWAPLKKQVRISGPVRPVFDEEADAYFKTRPRLSQVGAWASPQSRPMPHRYALETTVAATAAQFGIGPVPRPSNWSGFRLVPEEMEFWTERPFRHHDRVLYRRVGDAWEKNWLFP